MGELIGLVAIVMIFGIPITAILAGHHKNVLEMKLKMRQGGDQDVVSELRDLKQQMVDLRDTTTRYDLSFDAALQRLESRMGTVEERMGRVEHNAAGKNLVR